MAIEICTVGGYSECGKNCTAIKLTANGKTEVIILDLGLDLENHIKHTQDDREDIVKKEYPSLVKVNAVPNLELIKDWLPHLIGIIPSHGHLDHVGAIPFIAPMFPNVPIISTPYTIEVIKALCYGERIKLSNELISQDLNSTYIASKNIKIEFVEITHSIPHSSILKITINDPSDGSKKTVLYANDFKIDFQPVIGPSTNIPKLKQIGNEGLDLLICEALYAKDDKRTPSESYAKELLEKALLEQNLDDKCVIVTTFSSQIGRLKSIVEIGQKMNRKIVFLGRSLRKYCIAAQKLKIINFPKSIPFYSRRSEVMKVLEEIQKNGKEKYLIVCTGHQGEPRAQLSRIARDETPLKLDKNVLVLFSCSTIPVPLNIENRKILENLLKSKHTSFLTNLHASGHASAKDIFDFFSYTKPKQIIPSHGGTEFASALIKVAEKLDYKSGETVHEMSNGKKFTLN